ncbi:MAG: glycosyltransferase family 2 protein [Thermoproteota archaeon]
MTSSPKVSVIIPTYNRANCVGDAIRSVLDQTYKDFEIIVVDDGSTDNTSEVLAEFGDKIHVIRQENAGVSAARNAGIKAARGEWIAFLDSDDIWEPQKLEVQVRDLEAHPEVVAHEVDAIIELSSGGNINLFKLRGLSEEFKKHPLRERPLIDVLIVQMFTPCCLVRKEILDKVGYFDEDLSIHEDWNLLARVALEGPFFFNTYIGARIRRVPGNVKPLSYLIQWRRLFSLECLIKNYSILKDDQRLMKYERKFVMRNIGGLWCDIAEYYSKNRKWRRGMSAILKSLKADPGIRSFARAILCIVGARSFVSRKLGRRKGVSLRRSEIA